MMVLKRRNEEKNLVSAIGDFPCFYFTFTGFDLNRQDNIYGLAATGFPRSTHGPQGLTSGPHASFLGKYTRALEVPRQVRRGQGRVGLPRKGRLRWCTSPCVILY